MARENPRIVPCEAPFTAEVDEQLRRWMPPRSPVEPLGLFRTLCRNLPLASAMLPLGSFQLSKQSGLTTRQRELVILRTCARRGAAYEWGVHAIAYGALAGLDESTLTATVREGPEAFDSDDRLLVTFVDALVDQSEPTDELFAQLRASFSEAQILELTVLCGWYHIISFVCRVAAVAPEPWAAVFPTSPS